MDNQNQELWAELSDDPGIKSALNDLHISNDACAPHILESGVDRLAALGAFAEKYQVDVGGWLDELEPEQVQHLLLCIPLAQTLLATVISSYLFAQLEGADDDD